MELSTIPMESLSQLLQLQLDNGGMANLVVTGHSMYPTLRHRRDAVVLVPPRAPLKRGDLILYKRESGQYVLHRIVTKPKNGAFICSGDNQWQPEQVNAGQVMALVATYIRSGRHIPVDSLGCKLWTGLWVGLFPLRRPLLAARRAIGKLKRKGKK